MVAGLGTITPASGFVGPGGALVIGLTAGFVCFNAMNFMKRSLRVDDSLDVFPVHGVGGIMGTLFTGMFASAELGVFSGQGYAEGMTMGSQLLVQAVGVIASNAEAPGFAPTTRNVTASSAKQRPSERPRNCVWSGIASYA